MLVIVIAPCKRVCLGQCSLNLSSFFLFSKYIPVGWKRRLYTCKLLQIAPLNSKKPLLKGSNIFFLFC